MIVNKIPNLQTVEPVNFTYQVLKKSLRDAGIGEKPLAITIPSLLSVTKAHEVLEEIDAICAELKVNSKVPYPIFIICEEYIYHPHFIILSSADDISPYFKLKAKKLKKRENSLLNKVKILSMRINYYRIHKQIGEIKKHSQKHRKLKKACAHRAFYSNILERMKEAESQ